MERYIERKVKNIIEDIFKFSIDFNILYFEKFLTYERKNDIKRYKEYSLTSPEIYNICYLHLTKIEKLSKNNTIDVLKEEVEKNKEEMNIIKRMNYTPKEYKDILEKRKKEAKEVEERRRLEVIRLEKLNKNKYTNEKINWDIQEYELIRGDWNSVKV